MSTEIKNIPATLDFTYLPQFARFIREEHFDGFMREQLRLSKEIKMPLLKFFESISEDQLLEISRISTNEFLTFLVENKAKEQIADSLKKWLSNALPQVAREQITAEDITFVSFIRKQAFLAFLLFYSSDPAEIIEIIKEIDFFILESETASTHTFVQLFKDRINEEAHFKERIISTSPGIVYVLDLIRQRQIYSNAKLNTQLGYTDEELHGLGNSLLLLLMHPDDQPDVARHNTELLSTNEGEIRSFEFRLKARNGNYRWQRTYESIFRRTDEGKVWQIIGIAFDIQDEKSIAEQLKTREDQLLEAQELAEMGSFQWDIDTGESDVTPKFSKILQLKKGDDINVFFSKVHPADRQRVQMFIEEATQEKGVYDVEYRYVSNNTERILWSRGTVAVSEGRTIMKGTVMDVTDRNYMVQRLQRSEHLYKQAQAITHIGNYTWDLIFNKLAWSDELYRIYGLDPKEDNIDYEKIFSFNHPDDVNLVQERISKSVETHEPFDFYYRIVLGDKMKILHARGEVLVDESGKAYKLLGTAQDVTERQELIQRLQHSEDLYKQAQALTHIGNWSWDIMQNKVAWSDELYHIFGLDIELDEISFNKFVSYIHPEDKGMILDNIQKPHDLYYRVISKDGTVKIIHGKGEVLVDENGIPYKMIGTSQDVTEEKLIEKQLRDNQNFIQKIVDATPSIIASYNIHTGRYVFINQGLEKLLGHDPQQVLKEGVAFFAALIHPEDAPGIMEKNAKALEIANKAGSIQNEIIVEFQYRMLHKNGNYRWFHTYGTVFDRNSNGEVEHVLNISLDITDRVEAEQVLFQKNLELQQSNASLEEFAYVASHDLQEPLRKISTFGDRLLSTQQKNLDEDGKTYLEKIIISSIRMQQMINDLLSISMISGNKAFERYSLQKILGEVLQTLEHKIEESKAVIMAEQLPEANIVPSQFRQLFQNLLTNSLKFARAGVQPQITISSEFLKYHDVKQYNLTMTRRYLQITFADNGIGFNKIFADRIFAIFQRLHSRSQYEGTGIGLAICRKIIENHGGVIFASGVPDKGANFVMIIPV